MKNRIILGIFLAVMIFAFADAEAMATETHIEGLYPQTFIVTGVSASDHKGIQNVTIETVTGFVYQFESDAGDWMPGDLVSCIMNDAGTTEITDDIILSARYSGIAEWFVEINPST